MLDQEIEDLELANNMLESFSTKEMSDNHDKFDILVENLESASIKDTKEVEEQFPVVNSYLKQSRDDDLMFLFPTDDLFHDSIINIDAPATSKPIQSENSTKNEIHNAVHDLINDTSMNWSMKTWYQEVQKISGIEFADQPELKSYLRELVMKQGELMISLTQTQDVSPDLDDIFNDMDQVSQ